MISCKFYRVGLNILLLSHIAHTFVITVNMEDLKNLAKTFVADSVADQISDFVFRATKNMVDNQVASQESKNFDDRVSSHALSEENELNSRKEQSMQPLHERTQRSESDEQKPRNPSDEAQLTKTSKEADKQGKSLGKNGEKCALSLLPEPEIEKKTTNNETKMKAEEYDSAEIRVPLTEFKKNPDLQRSKAEGPKKTAETTTELDLFDTKNYKKAEKEDVSEQVSDNEGDVNWWEKELPHKGYDNVKVEENVGVK